MTHSSSQIPCNFADVVHALFDHEEWSFSCGTSPLLYGLGRTLVGGVRRTIEKRRKKKKERREKRRQEKENMNMTSSSSSLSSQEKSASASSTSESEIEVSSSCWKSYYKVKYAKKLKKRKKKLSHMLSKENKRHSRKPSKKRREDVSSDNVSSASLTPVKKEQMLLNAVDSSKLKGNSSDSDSHYYSCQDDKEHDTSYHKESPVSFQCQYSDNIESDASHSRQPEEKESSEDGDGDGPTGPGKSTSERKGLGQRGQEE
jgi:preprotein translocase subunit SecD